MFTTNLSGTKQYEVSETWTIKNLDSTVKTYVKTWLHLHQGANSIQLYLPI